MDVVVALQGYLEVMQNDATVPTFKEQYKKVQKSVTYWQGRYEDDLDKFQENYPAAMPLLPYTIIIFSGAVLLVFFFKYFCLEYEKPGQPKSDPEAALVAEEEQSQEHLVDGQNE